MIDVHCHLNFKAFSQDYDEVIKRALDKGVTRIINTGTSIESSKKAVELAEKYDELYAIVGVHPHHADKVESGWDHELKEVAQSSNKVVGIGEIGLDYFWYASNGIVDPTKQKEIFIRQIELANELSLPLQIHNRQAGEDVVEILEKHTDKIKQDPPGMFHCFASIREVHQKILEMGFYVGFDGNSTYSGLAKGETVSLSDFIQETPIDRIVTETDSPYLPPVPHRGSRNEPSHVIIVGQFISQIKDLSIEEVEAKTSANALKIFNLK